MLIIKKSSRWFSMVQGSFSVAPDPISPSHLPFQTRTRQLRAGHLQIALASSDFDLSYMLTWSSQYAPQRRVTHPSLSTAHHITMSTMVRDGPITSARHDNTTICRKNTSTFCASRLSRISASIQLRNTFCLPRELRMRSLFI